MKMPHHFIPQHPEQEPLNEQATSSIIQEEYIKNDTDRANSNTNFPTVFDSVDNSPYYDANELYIDERDLIELPPP